MKSGPRLVEPERRATSVTLSVSQCPYDVIHFLLSFIEPQGAYMVYVTNSLRTV
jgi:hypothetical protein